MTAAASSHVRSRILLGVMLIVCSSQTAKYLLPHDPSFQWDLVRNRAAARAYSLGLNPYHLDEVQRVEPDSPDIMFPYVPHTLFYFNVFNHVSPFWGGALYLVAKLVGVCVLFGLWTRTLLRSPLGTAEWFTLLFAFGAPIIKDVNSGNISVFEQAGLYGAIYLLMQGRPWIAALLIVSVAQFKLIPIALLGVLLLGPRPEWKALVGGLLLFLCVLGLNYFLMPEVFQQFLMSLGTHEEYGSIAAGTLTIIRDVVNTFGLEALDGRVSQIYVVVVAVALCWSSFVFVRAMWSLDSGFTIENRISLFLFTYFVCAPWFKNYSYIMLSPLAVLLYRGLPDRRQRGALLALIAVSALPIRTSVHPVLYVASEYSAYIVGVICYVWLTVMLLARRSGP